MTIRRRLLLAFLLVGLIPAAVLTGLAFQRAGAALRGEIAEALGLQARQLAADIDQMLFERLQNATTWNHLEVMQDLQLGDVDKRLSTFLDEMKRRYGGVYLDLHALDVNGQVVASSRMDAIGSREPPGVIWLRADLPGGQVQLERPQDDAVLVLRTPVPSQFGEAPLGELVLRVDWRQFLRLLDAAAGDARGVRLLDAQGQLLAAAGTVGRNPEDNMAATAPAAGYEVFQGFGWQVDMLQPLDSALAPVRRMALTFAGLLAATALATVLVAVAVAGSIARPVRRLADYTRLFARDGQAPSAPPPASGELGELTRVFVQMVEDLEQSRQTLVRASKLAAVGEMAAVMAHEIRTPLGILRSSAQMLDGEPALSAEGRELTGFITAETERLNRLVTAMLDSARQRPLRRQPTDAHALIEHCCALIAQQALRQDVTLHRALAAAHPVVDGDAEQLTQVLLNLLMNALQAVSSGGQITVTSRDDGRQLLIEVSDDGPGIPTDLLPRLFEPFVFRKDGGSGLGLAVVAQIIDAHGGSVAAHNHPQGGAVFSLRLPRPLANGLTGDPS